MANPETHLATIDSDDGRLSVEFNVERGQGFIPANNANGLPIGALPVDAIFTPVRKVNYEIEHVRVGQAIDKERLVLEVWSDGTISPLDAIREAGEALVDYFFLFANVDKVLEQGREKRPLALTIPPRPVQHAHREPGAVGSHAKLSKAGEHQQGGRGAGDQPGGAARHP